MHPQPDIEKWADVMMVAQVEKEPFDNVDVVTAKSEFVSLAFQAAADTLVGSNFHLTPSIVNTAAWSIISQRKVYVHEYVSVGESGIKVCLNVDNVESGEVTWRVMDVLARALDSLNGSDGTVRFGDPLTFNLSEVPWVIAEDFVWTPSVHGLQGPM